MGMPMGCDLRCLGAFIHTNYTVIKLAVQNNMSRQLRENNK